MKRILIVGAGAVGGYCGAHFSRAGLDVVLIDAWPAHVEAVRQGGLHITMMEPENSFVAPARILHICDVPQLVREAPFDLGLICVKSYDTDWATHLLLPYLAPTAPVVSMQNGINEDRIAGHAGWGRVLGCAIGLLAAELTAPGRISRNSLLGTPSYIGMRVGEPHGRITPRAQAIAALLAHTDSTKVTANLWGERWSKLTINAMRNAVSAMTGLSSTERDADPVARGLSIRLGSQAVRVGLAMGMALEPISGLDLDVLADAEHDPAAMAETTRQILAHGRTRNADQRPSMGQDIRKGRRTETAAINGLVAQRGTEYGVDATLHARVDALMQRVERGELSPARGLAEGL